MPGAHRKSGDRIPSVAPMGDVSSTRSVEAYVDGMTPDRTEDERARVLRCEHRELLLSPTEYLPPEHTLEGLTEADAQRRIAGAPHSVEKLVAHLVFWQDWFYARCLGEPRPLVASAAEGWPDVPDSLGDGSVPVYRRPPAACGSRREGRRPAGDAADRVSSARQLHRRRRPGARRHPQCPPPWPGYPASATARSVAAAGR